ncbi:MAG: hypothetical protein J6Y29_02225 [Clostridiales bacterium]|nr:hypothetical protein [Clostridiales bacterium]
MTAIFQLIFWLIMILNAILILVYAMDNMVFTHIFRKKVNLRLKNLEKTIYKEDK